MFPCWPTKQTQLSIHSLSSLSYYLGFLTRREQRLSAGRVTARLGVGVAKWQPRALAITSSLLRQKEGHTTKESELIPVSLTQVHIADPVAFCSLLTVYLIVSQAKPYDVHTCAFDLIRMIPFQSISSQTVDSQNVIFIHVH